MDEEFDFLKAVWQIRSLMESGPPSHFFKAFRDALNNEADRLRDFEAAMTESNTGENETPPQDRPMGSAQYFKVSLCYHLWWSAVSRSWEPCPWEKHYKDSNPRAEPQHGSRPVNLIKLSRAFILVNKKKDVDAAITVIDKIEEEDPPRIEAVNTITEDTNTSTNTSTLSSTSSACHTKDDLQNTFDNVFALYSGILSVIPDNQREFLRQAVLSLATTPWVSFNVGGIHRALQQKIMFPIECQIKATSSADVYDAVAQFCCFFAMEAGGLVRQEGMRIMKDWLHQQQITFREVVEKRKAQLLEMRPRPSDEESLI